MTVYNPYKTLIIKFQSQGRALTLAAIVLIFLF